MITYKGKESFQAVCWLAVCKKKQFHVNNTVPEGALTMARKLRTRHWPKTLTLCENMTDLVHSF